ncbi:MAG TPA: ABC transporter substrate-binding protein [Acidobacteriota bacterium]|nr:ABC transporter substrate-binding protein [Acidobacteriota bacterium]
MLRIKIRFTMILRLAQTAILVAMILGLGSCKSEDEKLPALIIAHESPFLSLDPQAYNDNATFSVLGNVYDALVSFDPEMKIQSALAERWENPNDLTWRFYLRKNVRFQNGKPLTADDVVYTVERGLHGNFAGIKPYLISVKSVKMINPLTVDIITDKPSPVLLNKLTFLYILPRSSQPDATIEDPVGTGAYRFVRRVGNLTVVLQANHQYWRGVPSIENVRFTSFPDDEQMVKNLLAGNVQLIRDFSEPLFDRVAKSDKAELVTRDSLSVTFLGFNLVGEPKTNPLANQQVRKAIYYAFDSQTLVKEALGGSANVALQLVSPAVFGYDPDYTPPLQNLENAKKTLSNAGYPGGFNSEVYSNDPNRLNKVTVQLKQIGINAEPKLVEWKNLNDQIGHHAVPMFTLGWSCSTGDAGDFLENCIHTADPAAGYGSANFAGYSNSEVDQMIEQSGITLKATERKLLLQKALAQVMTDLPYIPLFSRYRHYGVAKNLTWQPRRDGRLYAFEMTWKEP